MMTVTGGQTGSAHAADDTVAAVRAAVTTAGLTPKDAGARYGQALGAVEVCIGSKVSEKASALNSVYSGAELEAFKAQAAKVYDAGIKVKNCVHAIDPNQCRIIMEESCAAALSEIGPSGTALPELLEAPRR